MLSITIPDLELWDEINEEFVYKKGQTIELEYSLDSISKWESKHCKPFLTREERTHEEFIDYIRCMTLTENVEPEMYEQLSAENIRAIEKYIDAPMTATTFSQEQTKKNNVERPTAELIFYWMIAMNIPFECRKWHLNRLMTLIRVCSVKNAPPKKRSTRDIMKRNAALNAARRKRYNTRG